jgi:nitrite reductase/ring-hydroxylating ferredoxin subunit
MITPIVSKAKFLVAIVLLMGFSGCSPNLSDDAIPVTQFSDVAINLTLPEYVSLNTNGGWKYISKGVRGIIIYRLSNSTYYAFERNCSYHPNDACATVNVHASNLYMVDPCCNSNFDFTQGEPTAGPAWRPLNQYETILNGTTLTITDQIR